MERLSSARPRPRRLWPQVDAATALTTQCRGYSGGWRGGETARRVREAVAKEMEGAAGTEQVRRQGNATAA